MTIRVLQLICPTGYYGAERWITALLGASEDTDIEHHLAITDEPGASDEVLQRCGLPYGRQHRIRMASKFDLFAIVRLVRLIRREGIDIVHTHGYKSDILGMLAARLAGVRSVCTPHGFENASDARLKAYLWVGGKAFHGFDRVCPLSRDIEKTLIEHYRVNPSRIQRINNGVDLAEVEQAIQAPVARDDSQFTIGYIGQLISRKNLGATLDAFARFHEKYPCSRLQLIGDGDERASLTEKTRQLGLSDSVEFLGFRNDRLAFLPSFDAFALTSSLEGIPRCLMEAMAAKVCVTAFDIPGVDVLIKQGQTGVLVNNNDIVGLSDAWMHLVLNPAEKDSLAAAGKFHVYTHFSAQAMEEAYASLYRDLMPAQVGANA